MKCRDCFYWRYDWTCRRWPSDEPSREGMAVTEIKLSGYSPDCGLDDLEIKTGPEFGCVGFKEDER